MRGWRRGSTRSWPASAPAEPPYRPRAERDLAAPARARGEPAPVRAAGRAGRAGLAGVAGYTLGITVPHQFHRHYRLYQDALADSAPPPVDRAAMGRRVEAGAGGRLGGDRARAPPRPRRSRAGDRAPDRRRGRRPATAKPWRGSAARRRTWTGWRRLLEQPAAAWLADGAAGLDAALEKVLAEVGDLAAAWGPPLDPVHLVGQLRGQPRWRSRPRSASCCSAGRILGVSPGMVRAEQGGGLALAPALARARAALAAYLGPAAAAGRRALPGGRARPSRPGASG